MTQLRLETLEREMDRASGLDDGALAVFRDPIELPDGRVLMGGNHAEG